MKPTVPSRSTGTYLFSTTSGVIIIISLLIFVCVNSVIVKNLVSLLYKQIIPLFINNNVVTESGANSRSHENCGNKNNPAYETYTGDNHPLYMRTNKPTLEKKEPQLYVINMTKDKQKILVCIQTVLSYEAVQSATLQQCKLKSPHQCTVLSGM